MDAFDIDVISELKARNTANNLKHIELISSLFVLIAYKYTHQLLPDHVTTIISLRLQEAYRKSSISISSSRFIKQFRLKSTDQQFNISPVYYELGTLGKNNFHTVNYQQVKSTYVREKCHFIHFPSDHHQLAELLLSNEQSFIKLIQLSYTI